MIVGSPGSDIDHDETAPAEQITSAAHYSKTVTPRAIELLGLSGRMAAELRYSLGFVHDHAVLWSRHGKPSNRSQTVRSLVAIESAATRLLTALRAARDRAEQDSHADQAIALLTWSYGKAVAPDQPEPAIQDGRADDRLQALESELEFLIREAREAVNGQKDRMRSGQGGPRRTSDRARDEVLDFLAQIYTEVTGKRPMASASEYADGGADSQFIRFAALCFAHLGWRDSTGAIRERHRRLLAQRTTGRSRLPSTAR